VKKQALTVKIAKWSANHPWFSIIGWVLFIVLCVTIGNITGSIKTQQKDFWVGEAGRAEAIIAYGDMVPPSIEKILIESQDGSVLNRDHSLSAAEDISQRLSTQEAIDKVYDPIFSGDGKALMVEVTLKEGYKGVDYVQSLRDQTEAAQAEYPDLQIEETGDASISKGNEEMLGGGLQRAEMITFPITLIILFLVFGRLLAAGVPLILAVSSIIGTMGLYKAATYVFPDAGGAVTNVILMIGLAVGVDYSLFYLKRVREERERSGGQISHKAAIELAAATSGRSILISGLAVLISLIGLYVADDVIFSSIATGSIIVVMIAMVSSLTVLPALLAKLGKKMDSRRSTKSKTANGLLATILKLTMRRPLMTFLVAVIALIALSIPAFDLQLRVEGKETFPRAMPAMAAYDRLTEAFPAEGVSHVVAVQSDRASSVEVKAALNNLWQQTENDPLFVKNETPQIRTSADGQVSILELPIPFTASSEEAIESLERIRLLVPNTVGEITGIKYAVSGEVARSVDTVDNQNDKIPYVAGFVLLFSFSILLIAFRSVVIAFIGILLNMLAAAAALGALVVVFQYNWVEFLGLSGGGFVSSRIPLLLFVILFGLSTDYQVFVVSRIKEAVDRGLSTREAVFEGITGSATVVTSAAVVMMSVFVSFMFVPYLELKETGFGLMIAVLLDAFIIRIIILPAILTLIGHAVWWPSRLVRQSKAVD
jgi:RND superfamily putative drug exporter